MVELLGAAHTVGYVNNAFCRLLGKNRADLIGQPFAAIVPGGELALPLLNEVYETTGEYAHWTDLEESDAGSTRWLYATYMSASRRRA